MRRPRSVLHSLTVFALFAGALGACVETEGDSVSTRPSPCASAQPLRAQHWGWNDNDWDDSSPCPKTSADAGAVTVTHDGAVGTEAPDSGIAQVPGTDSGSASDGGGGGNGGNDTGSNGSGDASASMGGDAGTSTGTTAPDAGAAHDAGTADSGMCQTSASCATGTQCVAGTCQPCSNGVCICMRDDDCPGTQVCDHQSGTCTNAPPTCVMITMEAQCIARQDCKPIYAGMNCTNSMGSTCQSGQANCTCATYAFAACVSR